MQFWRSSSGGRNIKILRLCRQNHSESTDSELNLRPPDCNRTRPKSRMITELMDVVIEGSVCSFMGFGSSRVGLLMVEQ